MDLDALINNLEAFNFEAEQQTIVHENLDELSNLQKQQFAQGTDGKGEPIILKDNGKYGYGYRPFTIEQKKLYGIGLGAVTDHITLYGQGNLYDELSTKMDNNTFSTYSPVPYWSTLVNRLNKEATELSEQSRLSFAERIVLPAIDAALKEKVFNR
jgi:hypothetical protein